jgi:hypothetical protein
MMKPEVRATFQAAIVISDRLGECEYKTIIAPLICQLYSRKGYQVRISDRRSIELNLFMDFLSISKKTTAASQLNTFSDVLPDIPLFVWVHLRMAASVVYSSEFLATDPEVRVRFPALPDFLRSSGSGTGSTQPREYS